MSLIVGLLIAVVKVVMDSLERLFAVVSLLYDNLVSEINKVARLAFKLHGCLSVLLLGDVDRGHWVVFTYLAN